ncbi:FAD-dependent monooxygenase [Sphingomonas crocodyli]|uniref:FAD-binding monooxygenase n=1 Tax=Sphingomonas crocodyli TaxID=1979270 RepID=A0A437LYK2_9SPHN|nr:FAD-dependent monooxygenase [Sphingomonas crocodyli]RVT90490.1 FAD-binding monooxygenase [Sphingomonas crocodyli]
MSKHILITGASIAGNAAAAALLHEGFDVTVVEREPAFRDGGQNIDVRGVGREVLRLMGLDAIALAQGTGEEGTVWVNADGSEAARFLASEIEGDGPTAEMEILRGDLARLLYDAVSDEKRFRFGDHIVGVEEKRDAVAVTFASGVTADYDALIVAEGVGSSTRELVFAGENDPRWMDLTIAYFTIPTTPNDDRMWRWYNAPGKRSVSLRPDRHGTARAMLSIAREAGGAEHWDVDQQKAFLRACFADAGWETPRILAAMDDADDFYFDALRQVRMPRWSHGRVVLTGDAAWCATPLAGIGATLAVTGAYVLAQELAGTHDVEDAFKAYEDQMRPMVEDGQGVPKIAPRLMHPKSRLGIRLLHGVLGLASLEPVRDLTARLVGAPDKEVDLSRYDRAPYAVHGDRSNAQGRSSQRRRGATGPR